MDRGRFVVLAIEENRFDFVDTLLRSGSISPLHRGEAVIKAVQKKSIQILKALLRGGEIRASYRGLALEYASTGEVTFIHTLFENRRIPVVHRGKAVESATAEGLIENVQYLLKNGPIPEIYQKSALEIAKKKGNQELVDLLQSASIVEAQSESSTLLEKIVSAVGLLAIGSLAITGLRFLRDPLVPGKGT